MFGTGCILGIAPRTSETLPDFHEWCRVTRHPRIFHGLTGCQRDPQFWGVTGKGWRKYEPGGDSCPHLKEIATKGYEPRHIPIRG